MSYRFSPQFFLCALVLPCACSSLEAQQLSFQGAPAAVTGTYLLDSSVSFARTIAVQHKGSACSYFVTFSAGQSWNFSARAVRSGANLLQYQIYDNLTYRNVLEDLSANPSLSQVLTGSFTSGNPAQWATQNLSYVAYLLPGQLPPAGTYYDTVTMKLYTGTPASPGQLLDTTSFAIAITMSSSLDISLVSTGSPFNTASTSFVLGFGTFVAGENRTADLIVRSNRPSTVTVTSQYGGIMKDADPLDKSQVPYAFTVNGSAFALPPGAPQTIVSSAPATPIAGTRYAISVTIVNFGSATEGSYSDIVTVSALAN